MNGLHRMIVFFVVSCVVLVQSEGHVESPAFKYSREANEAAQVGCVLTTKEF